MVINCNGLKGRDSVSQFRAHIDQHKPDVIIGC